MHFDYPYTDRLSNLLEDSFLNLVWEIHSEGRKSTLVCVVSYIIGLNFHSSFHEYFAMASS